MLQTIEAIIDEQGHVHLLEAISLPKMQRAIVTILGNDPLPKIPETALLSESALA